MNTNEQDLKRLGRTLWILWGAFLSAPIVYLVAGFLISSGRGSAYVTPAQVMSLRPIFYALGGVFLLAAFLIRSRLMARAYAEPYAAMMGVQAAFVAGWAIAEAVAILGLVLLLMGGNLGDVVPFMALAFVAIAVQRPGGDSLRRLGAPR